MAERLMIALTKKGMGRQEAHELVRTMAQEAFKSGKHLRDVVLEKKAVTEEEADEIFNPETYIGEAEKIVENALKD